MLSIRAPVHNDRPPPFCQHAAVLEACIRAQRHRGPAVVEPPTAVYDWAVAIPVDPLESTIGVINKYAAAGIFQGGTAMESTKAPTGPILDATGIGEMCPVAEQQFAMVIDDAGVHDRGVELINRFPIDIQRDVVIKVTRVVPISHNADRASVHDATVTDQLGGAIAVKETVILETTTALDLKNAAIFDCFRIGQHAGWSGNGATRRTCN